MAIIEQDIIAARDGSFDRKEPDTPLFSIRLTLKNLTPLQMFRIQEIVANALSVEGIMDEESQDQGNLRWEIEQRNSGHEPSFVPLASPARVMFPFDEASKGLEQ